MKTLPEKLIYSRLIIGISILVLSITHFSGFKMIAASLFIIGILTDIFDGIIARKFNTSSQNLRRLDSSIDQVFFILVAAALLIRTPRFFDQNKVEIIILVGIECVAYLVCFIKFKKEIATHSIASKIWTLLLSATIIELFMTSDSSTLFQVCFYLGVLTRLEIIAIIFVLKKWNTDVPGLYQAILLRKGKPIKRHKLFNG